jgi:glycosyltransferase A (GT-A) superfamily protein (DUF2064 family)
LDVDVFTGVPMSTPATATNQLIRLQRAGHSVTHLPWLTDVDNFHDALKVAAHARQTIFAAVVRRLSAHLGGVA